MSEIELLPGYDTKLFCEIFEAYNDFYYYYLHCGLPTTITSDIEANPSSLKTLYYLLYARYGNSPIANYDQNQFIYKIFSIIFQYGPTWEKRLNIQSTLRGLTEDELLKGSKAIYNHAYNPETEPTTTTLEELEYINEQNSTNYKKSKMDAYTQLWNLLETDVTEEFIRRFNTCFKKFVKPSTYIYETEEM